MQLTLPRQTSYQPYERINTVVMTTDAEICEFLEEICEVPESVEDDLAVFKHADDAPESCQLVCTETFDWMPDEVVQTFVIQANPFEVSLQGGLILDSF